MLKDIAVFVAVSAASATLMLPAESRADTWWYPTAGCSEASGGPSLSNQGSYIQNSSSSLAVLYCPVPVGPTTEDDVTGVDVTMWCTASSVGYAAGCYVNPSTAAASCASATSFTCPAEGVKTLSVTSDFDDESYNYVAVGLPATPGGGNNAALYGYSVVTN